jgi:hypothetical protein
MSESTDLEMAFDYQNTLPIHLCEEAGRTERTHS